MYYFVGKFSHETKSYADNELWTVHFPGRLTVDSPAVIVLQWTKTADGQAKRNAIWTGKVTSRDGANISIFRNDSGLYYWFEGTVGANEDSITLTMKNPKNEYCGNAGGSIVFKA